MLAPIDGWTLAHGLAGFFAGKIKIRRIFLYPVPFLWEIYQLFFHYGPRGESLEYVWLNSVFDVLVFLVMYEISNRLGRKHYQMKLPREIFIDAKGICAYFLITSGMAWLFWDDIFRLKLGALMPIVQLPLLFGAFSPFLAWFIVRRWIGLERNELAASAGVNYKRRFNYWIFGILPSVMVYSILLSLTFFWHLL
jgi:hypothetical protein